MAPNDLQQRIDAFPVWHYRFELDGATTPIFRPDAVNRHEQRRRMAFDPLVAAAGGSLQGRRVLDLGCNAGYWSLAAIEAGADFVFGIDGRQMHLDQANLVFEAKGIEQSRYRFAMGNIFTYEFAQQFDVVLCLGLMYHIAKPVELFEVISGVAASLVLIDTTVSLLPTSAFRVAYENSLDNPRNAVDYELVLIPTRQAVIDLARQFGFETVPLAARVTDYTGMEDYKSKQRAAFVCAKGIALDALQPERTDQATLALALAQKVAKRTLARGRRLLAR